MMPMFIDWKLPEPLWRCVTFPPVASTFRICVLPLPSWRTLTLRGAERTVTGRCFAVPDDGCVTSEFPPNTVGAGAGSDSAAGGAPSLSATLSARIRGCGAAAGPGAADGGDDAAGWALAAGFASSRQAAVPATASVRTNAAHDCFIRFTIALVSLFTLLRSPDAVSPPG